MILGYIKKVIKFWIYDKNFFHSQTLVKLLNSSDYSNEMKSLTNFSGIEYICICINKIFIQSDDESKIKEAFN